MSNTQQPETPVWLNYYKHSANEWMYFSTREAANEFMHEQGGFFTVRYGSFDPKWIDEVIEEENRGYEAMYRAYKT